MKDVLSGEELLAPVVLLARDERTPTGRFIDVLTGYLPDESAHRLVFAARFDLTTILPTGDLKQHGALRLTYDAMPIKTASYRMTQVVS
jgi:hypothetical protein